MIRGNADNLFRIVWLFRIVRPAWIFCALLLLVPACRLTPVEPDPPEVDHMIKIADEFGYLLHLREKPRATTPDAARITFLLIDGYPWNKDMTGLRKALLEKEAVMEEWEISDAAPLTRGKLAYMMCAAAGIKTSMVMQLTYPNERMSLREMVFHQLMPMSSTYRYVSGSYLLDVVSRTDIWMERNAEE